jgi:hypothetical protein
MNHIIYTYHNPQNLDAYDRIINATLGTILIGAVFTPAVGGYLGWFSLLPIIAIYPCLASITGYSPIRAALNAIIRRIQQRWSYSHAVQNGYMNIFDHYNTVSPR